MTSTINRPCLCPHTHPGQYKLRPTAAQHRSVICGGRCWCITGSLLDRYVYLSADLPSELYSRVAYTFKPAHCIFTCRFPISQLQCHDLLTLTRTLPMCLPCAMNLNAASTSSRSKTLVCSGFTVPSRIPVDTRWRTVGQSGLPGSKSASSKMPWNDILRRNTDIPTTIKWWEIQPTAVLDREKLLPIIICYNLQHIKLHVLT